MVMLVIMVMGVAAILVRSMSSTALQIKRDKITADALVQAKEALIGYATSVNLFSGSARLGDLPCPDNHTPGGFGEGTPSTPCDQQAQRLGRLPWKTLGLPDLRDGNGERLWYAVSNNFKNSTRTTCTAPGQAGCLNSDTVGTITFHSSDSNIIYDATLGNGAAAVIIAPGEVLQRQDGLQQDRSSSTNINTASNYLDIANGINNASFTDNTTNGFIQGRIKDNNGNLIVNDQLLVITQGNIMLLLQKRVAAEVRLCLEDYASNNNGRYPWAAPLNDLGAYYHDINDQYFGRVPDYLDNTWSDSFTGFPSFTYTMDNHWGTCNTHTNNTPRTWWINWKEMVFYGVARSFRPNDTPSSSFPSTCATPGRCLNINDSSAPARFVVIVAGKKLDNPDQTQRNTNKTNAFYYLEGGNENADPNPPSNISNTFIQSTPSASFNDTLVYQ